MTASNPKISVIVPVFNVKRYLKECMDSILNQTLQEIEIICGDGGSNDGSLEILHEYTEKDPRVKVISKDGSGYGQSVNDCMDVATGEYIGIVESDDVVKSDMFEKLYNRSKESDLDWIRSDIYLYYSEKPVDEQLVRESTINNADFYNEILNPQKDYRPYRSSLRTWSGIYKREFLNSNGIRHNETPGGSYQDVGFFLKTFYYAHRVMFIDEAFYMWRQDNPSSSIHYDPMKLVQKSLKEWSLGREYLESHKELGRMAYGSYNYRKFLSYRWTISMAEGESEELAKKTARDELTEALRNGEINGKFFDNCDWKEFKSALKNDGLKDRLILRKESLVRRF